MAETPDIWPRDRPEWRPQAPPSSTGPVRPIGGRAPRFGVARELDVDRRPGWDAGTRATTPRRPMPARVARPRESMGSRLGSWWACRDLHPSDMWRRMRCRSGHHQIEGGQQIQLGSRFVNTERCCVWCGHKPW